MGNHICHHEIPADDPKRASEFYASVFGWKMTCHEIESQPYYLFCTGGETGGGGILKRCEEFSQPCNYIQVDNIPDFCKRIVEAGGKVLVEETPIPPNFGFYAMCQDTEGNVFGLWSHKPCEIVE